MGACRLIESIPLNPFCAVLTPYPQENDDKNHSYDADKQTLIGISADQFRNANNEFLCRHPKRSSEEMHEHPRCERGLPDEHD